MIIKDFNDVFRADNVNVYFVGNVTLAPKGIGIQHWQLSANRDYYFNSKLNKNSKKVYLRSLSKTAAELYTRETLGELFEKLEAFSKECNVTHYFNIFEYDKSLGSDVETALRGKHTCRVYKYFKQHFEDYQKSISG